MLIPAKIVSLCTRTLSQIARITLEPSGFDCTALVVTYGGDEQIVYRATAGDLRLPEARALKPRAVAVWKGWGDVLVFTDGAKLRAQGDGGVSGAPADDGAGPGPMARDWSGCIHHAPAHAPTLLAALKAVVPVVGDDEPRFHLWLDEGDVLGTNGAQAKVMASGVGQGGLTVGVPASTARRWVVALTALAKSGGRWSVELAGERVALVWRRDDEELRIEATPRTDGVKPSSIRRALAASNETADRVRVDAWAVYELAKVCGGEVWVFSNGAVLATDKDTPGQIGLCGKLPNGQKPIGGWAWEQLKGALPQPAGGKRARPDALTLLVRDEGAAASLQIEGVEGLVMGIRHEAYRQPELDADDYEAPPAFHAAAE